MRKKKTIQRRPDAQAPGAAMDKREFRQRMEAAGFDAETIAPVLGMSARRVRDLLSGAGPVRYLVGYAVRHLQ